MTRTGNGDFRPNLTPTAPILHAIERAYAYTAQGAGYFGDLSTSCESN